MGLQLLGLQASTFFIRRPSCTSFLKTLAQIQQSLPQQQKHGAFFAKQDLGFRIQTTYLEGLKADLVVDICVIGRGVNLLTKSP